MENEHLVRQATLTGGHIETFKNEREAICKEVEARVPNRAENLLRGFRRHM